MKYIWFTWEVKKNFVMKQKMEKAECIIDLNTILDTWGLILLGHS